MDLLDNFLNILKVFMLVESDFMKLLRWRMDGVRRERSMAKQLRQSWPEAKSSANGGSLNYILFTEPLCIP
jgi:hypothetical protein